MISLSARRRSRWLPSHPGRDPGGLRPGGDRARAKSTSSG